MKWLKPWALAVVLGLFMVVLLTSCGGGGEEEEDQRPWCERSAENRRECDK